MGPFDAVKFIRSQSAIAPGRRRCTKSVPTKFCNDEASITVMSPACRVFNFALMIFNLDTLYETVEREAARLGTAIAESELIGFIPQAAYFDESRIIENRIAQLLQAS